MSSRMVLVSLKHPDFGCFHIKKGIFDLNKPYSEFRPKSGISDLYTPISEFSL